MRCTECGEWNEEGAAFCARCNAPLTKYGGQSLGEVSAATRAKAAQLAVRPPVIPAMAASLVLLALFGPMGALLSRFVGRTTVNAEGTNYMGAAFGAVGIALAALTLVPLALALLVVAWGTWTQHRWAWMIDLVVLCIVALMSLAGLWPHVLPLRVVLILAAVGLGYFWLRPETQRWYGVD